MHDYEDGGESLDQTPLASGESGKRREHVAPRAPPTAPAFDDDDMPDSGDAEHEDWPLGGRHSNPL